MRCGFWGFCHLKEYRMETIMSLYDHVKTNIKNRDITLEAYIERIKDGDHQKTVMLARQELLNNNNPKGYNEHKSKLPGVTGCGVIDGETRTDANTILNGYIVLDIDRKPTSPGDDRITNEEIEAVANDPHTKLVHRTPSEWGICVLVKINPDRFLDSFKGLELYYMEKFGMSIDASCKNPGRFRFLSYDPSIIVNDKCHTFKKYPKKVKIKEPAIIVVKSDFDAMVAEVQQRGIDLTNDDYSRFLRIGFAIATEFGEGGRGYFHAITGNAIKYNQKTADKQFTHCLNGDGGVSIGTLYYYALDAGIEIYSKETTNMIRTVSQHKRRGHFEAGDDAINEVFTRYTKTNEIEDSEENRELFKKIANSKKDLEKALKFENESETAILQNFIRTEYPLRLNEYTNKKELEGGKVLDDRGMNKIWIDADIAMAFDVSQSKVRAIMDNTDVDSFNPLREFLHENKDIQTENEVQRLVDTLSIEGDIAKRDLIKNMVKKWVVSMFTVLENDYSPLVLVLQGAQGDGKSYWFEHLLPDELKRYFAMSEFNGTKDDLSMMHANLLLVNDEFGGQTIKDSQKFKEMVSKNFVKYRPPYGREEQEFKRIALFAGTTNEETFLNDATGNRRIVPVRLKPNEAWTDGDGWQYSIDQEAFNAINKTALIVEAWNIYKSGFDFRVLREDIEALEENTKDFQIQSQEHELVFKHFRVFDDGKMTSTDVKVALIAKSGITQLGTKKIGAALRELGAIQKNSEGRWWNVRLLGEDESDPVPWQMPDFNG